MSSTSQLQVGLYEQVLDEELGVMLEGRPDLIATLVKIDDESTRYKDYLISRSRLHWESQAATTQASKVGQNYIHFRARGYTVLFFARLDKRIEGETSPFIFLGPAASLCSYESNRPMSMVWDLSYPVPAELFEAGRVG